ncbi:Shikimate 5-dehydrogenase I alpha [hydrothermal vent metagenome]|uniref:shikimate dehydrogenase (NADP(+)) n=1 Tax=hydrothermal vent metagenome TaxID=652676 RepID=A0A3B0TV57_9ZZZZ
MNNSAKTPPGQAYPSGQERQAFVIGHPIAHSLSPLIHGYWLKHYSLAGSYCAHDILPDRLEEFFNQLKSGVFVGANITLPHKEQALKLCEIVSDEAKTIGAVNTIYLRNGKICATNTDAYGFLANLDQKQPGWSDKNDIALVLGAGGAARAILLALLKRRFKKIILLNRTEKKAQILADHFNAQTDSTLISAAALDQFNRFAPIADFLVNTTSVGLNGTSHHGLQLDKIKKTALISDIVYNPLQTPLLKDAASLGLANIDGLGMLLHQAVPGFELWFGVRPKVTDELRQMIVRQMQK